MHYFSSLNRAKKAVTLCLRYKDILQTREMKNKAIAQGVVLQLRAETDMIKYAKKGVSRRNRRARTSDRQSS